ncbi:MAG: PAS domain S-box protein [Bryobacteraceae bacterium]
MASGRSLHDLSLGVKVTLGTLGLFLLAVLVQTAVVRRLAWNQEFADATVELAANADLRADLLGREIRRLRDNALFLAGSASVTGLARTVAAGGKDPVDGAPLDSWRQRLAEDFEAVVRFNTHYYQIRFIGRADGGPELVRVERTGLKIEAVPRANLQKKGDRNYFKAALSLNPGEYHVSEVDLNREHGVVAEPRVRTLRVSVPVFVPEGSVAGIVVINMDVGRILDDFEGGLPSGRTTIVLNSEGDFLKHPNQGRAFGFDLGSRHRWQDEVSGTERVSPGLDRFTLDGKSYVGVTREVPPDSLHPHVRLTVISARLLDGIEASVGGVTSGILKSAGLGAVLLSGILYLYLRRAAVPLKELAAVAARAAEGHFDRPAPVHAGGEVGAVARSFAHMQTALEAREEANRKLTRDLAKREQFANLVIDTAPGVMLIVDDAGRIVRTNSQVLRTLGYRPAELAGKPLEILLPDHLRSRHEALRVQFRDSEARRMGEGRELFGRRKDGSEVRVEVGLAPMADADGNCYVIAALSDVTARVEAEQKLRSSQEQFRILVENAADHATFLVDPAGRIASWNLGAQRLYGYHADEIVGKPADRLRASESGSWTSISEAAARDGSAHEEAWRVRKDGNRFYAEVFLHRLYDADGVLTGYAKVTRDITARRETELAILRQAREIRELNANLEHRVEQRTAELARSNRELEAFAYAASHDLQEPLRMVASFTEMLAQAYRGRLDDTADEYIRFAVEGARRMQLLIEDLLNLSRIGRRPPRFEEVDSGDVVRLVLQALGPALSDSGGRVDVAGMPRVWADSSLLAILLQNLVANAIKFKGSAPPEIGISAERGAGEWIFEVRDNGIGIAQQHHERIFGMFKRLHARNRYPGSGIGLAMAKKVAEAHGGRISVESSPGAGAVFRFTIPDRTSAEQETE